ncbi:LysM peptidoglycan-binding domain-containing protein [Diplocloster hominis]|uniref:LysM peptidoglycan-binding domain-containing protein n=1 Tax=Diplocloster hominis TaxID=3079010 RepID=UPI0031BA5E09
MENSKKRRGNRILIRKFGILVFSFCLLAALSISVGVSVKAEGHADPDVTYKYFKSIQVEAGDTLWSIAQEYCSEEYPSLDRYMKELVSMNHLENEYIQAGQYITVPYYSHEYIR